ncbi:hypothetical protein V8E53_011120 [Lactarius tabidus]
MYDSQALLIDGYISQTFQSRTAEKYFLNLLKSSSIPPHTTVSYTSRGGCFFFVHSVPPHIPAPFFSPTCRWLLDRGITDGDDSTSNWGSCRCPSFSKTKMGALGFSLEASVDGQYHVLRHANVLAPLGQKTTTHIRIIWPGYKTFKRQIPIRDESRVRSPITMAKFLCQVGRTVDSFLRVYELDSECVDDKSRLWRIGPGGIQRCDIVIIGAVHVSVGSWMPLLQLNRYIF